MGIETHLISVDQKYSDDSRSGWSFVIYGACVVYVRYQKFVESIPVSVEARKNIKNVVWRNKIF